MMMWGWGGPWMLFGGLMMWAVPLLIIGLIVWAFSGSRRAGAYGHHGQGSSESLEILKLRLAKGEISEEEYRRLKEVLK